MKKTLLTIAAGSAFVLWPMLASAHTIDVCWRDEADGSVTVFAATYHPGAIMSGGIIFDGVEHDFSGEVFELPTDITACQTTTCNVPNSPVFDPQVFFTVNIPEVEKDDHEIRPTCTSGTECGWPFCYPIVDEMGTFEDSKSEPPPPCEPDQMPELSSSSDELEDGDGDSQSDEDSDSVSDSQSDESVDPHDLDSDSISLEGGPSISLSDYTGCNPYLPLPEPDPTPLGSNVPDEDDGGFGFVGGCSAGTSGGAMSWLVLAFALGLAWTRRRR